MIWPSAAAGTIDHGWQETALLRGPGAVPRRSDDRRALAAAYDVVADVHARPCGMSGNLCPALQGHVQMVHVEEAGINHGLRDCMFSCPLSLRGIVGCTLLFSLLDYR